MRHALLLCTIAVVSACGGSTSPEALPSLFIRSPNGAVMDVASTPSYAPALVVGNKAEGDAAGCTITGFDVTVTDVGGKTLATFHSDAAGFVDGAHAGTPSFATFTATLLDDATIVRTALSAGSTERVFADVSVTGTSVAGTAVRSLPIQITIEVCSGCLVALPPNVGRTR